MYRSERTWQWIHVGGEHLRDQITREPGAAVRTIPDGGGGPDASLEGTPFDLPIPKAGTGAQPSEIEDLELVLVGVGLGLAMVALTALVE